MIYDENGQVYPHTGNAGDWMNYETTTTYFTKPRKKHRLTRKKRKKFHATLDARRIHGIMMNLRRDLGL